MSVAQDERDPLGPVAKGHVHGHVDIGVRRSNAAVELDVRLEGLGQNDGGQDFGERSVWVAYESVHSVVCGGAGAGQRPPDRLCLSLRVTGYQIFWGNKRIAHRAPPHSMSFLVG